MSNCQGRCLTCAYRGEIRTGDVERTSCAYILITGHSRLKEAYRCRCYRKGTPMRDDSQTRVPLVSSDPVRAKATEARVRANAARKKEEERERILKKEKRSYTKPDKPPTVDPVQAAHGGPGERPGALRSGKDRPANRRGPGHRPGQRLVLAEDERAAAGGKECGAAGLRCALEAGTDGRGDCSAERRVPPDGADLAIQEPPESEPKEL